MSDEAMGYVGRTANGSRIWLKIELGAMEGEQMTVTHGTVCNYWQLSISLDGVYKGSRRRDIDFGGQCVDELREVTTPAKGWTIAELGDLADIWD